LCEVVGTRAVTVLKLLDYANSTKVARKKNPSNAIYGSNMKVSERIEKEEFIVASF